MNFYFYSHSDKRELAPSGPTVQNLWFVNNLGIDEHQPALRGKLSSFSVLRAFLNFRLPLPLLLFVCSHARACRGDGGREVSKETYLCKKGLLIRPGVPR